MAEREFPTPTEEVDEQVEALRERGYVVLEDVLDRTEVAVLKEALAPYLQGKRHGRNDFEGFHTERTYALLAKSAEFVRIVDHSRISPIVDQLLEPTYLLWAALAINLHPGETRQRLHRDNLGGPGSVEDFVYGVSTMWALDDFTEDNGATLMIPGSHRWPADRSLVDEEDNAVRMTMRAGSVLVWSGAMVHAGGTNRSAANRLGITVQFCQPWLRPLESFLLSVPPEKARHLPERIQELLGYSLREPGIMGYVDGMHPKRVLNPDYQGRKAHGIPS
ncbi:MAG: phytanoyl-CoA dioxygenase family protein [Gammaproteobacteria bacterium]|nr:phytanoyl-CoA dioxygenase family protein [Gammaproteobacteria bacterium]